MDKCHIKLNHAIYMDLSHLWFGQFGCLFFCCWHFWCLCLLFWWVILISMVVWRFKWWHSNLWRRWNGVQTNTCVEFKGRKVMSDFASLLLSWDFDKLDVFAFCLNWTEIFCFNELFYFQTVTWAFCVPLRMCYKWLNPTNTLHSFLVMIKYK